MNNKKAPLSAHLQELRKTILISSISILACILIVYFFCSEQIMTILVSPISRMNLDLKFISVTEGFLAYIKISVFGGVVLSSPILFWQFIAYVYPGLYKKERFILSICIFFGSVLFIIGVVFAYYIVFELALRAFLIDYSKGLTPFITISNYISFTIKLLLPFGLVFEMPLIILSLTRFNVINPNVLIKWRKYAILIILIIAAFLTPPDVISQTLIAVPMYILYELSIQFARLAIKFKRNN